MSKLLETAREHRAATATLAVVGLLVTALLGWLFQPWQLFLDTEVDEAFPVQVSGAVEDPPPALVGDDTPPAAAHTPDAPAGDRADDRAGETSGGAAAAPDGPTLLRSGEFRDRSHPASGTVGIFAFEDGSRVLRIEDLETDSGPDLYVYLSAADADAPADAFDDEFVSLGRLKGNLGSQNYDVPTEVDLSRFSSVVIWCDRFDVAFGSAALSPA